MSTVDTENVPITGPTAQRLADLVGVDRDLLWVAKACTELCARDSLVPRDEIALQGIHDAALIRYGRCFKEGKRKAFQIPAQWIADLPEELQRVHRDVLNLRDKHIAHSVNDWEVNVPCAVVATIRGRGVSTVKMVVVRHSRVDQMSIADLRSFSQLAKLLAQRVATVGAEVTSKLHKEVSAISPRELKRRAPKFPEPGRRRVSATRS